MTKSSITKNYIYNLAYQILLIITPIITTPYLSRILGSEKLGVYGYTNSIVSCFILFGGLGITLYAQREIAFVQEDKEKRSTIFWEIIILKFITVITSIIIYYFTCLLNNEYKYFYLIYLIEIIANLIDISWLFQGLEQFKKTISKNTLVRILATISIIVFVKKPEDLYKYILIQAISVLIGNLSLWINLYKYVDKIKKINIKRHIKPVILLFIPQIALQIYMVLDKTMIGWIVTDKSEVGFYEQAQKIIRLIIAIMTSLSTVMVPRISNMYAKNDKKQINIYIRKII